MTVLGATCGPSTRSPRTRSMLEIDAAARGMVRFRVEIDPREVVFVKSLVEASEGLASIFAESGGSLTIATPASRRDALVELLSDLVTDHGAYVEPDVSRGGRP